MDPALDATVTPAQPDEKSAGPVALPAVDAELYVKQRELGAGGMGRTYRARERRLDRVVALKQIRTDTGMDPAMLEAQFEREARLTARLQHPSIVSIYEAGRFVPSGAPFYAMRLIDGVPLDDKIKRAAGLGERLALVPHVATVVHAIAYAHEQRIVHRDLKPANIVLGKHGEAIIIDWGIACDLDEPAAKQRGNPAGTPAYMAPEQANGDVVSPSFDVYALGATLYHVLAGHMPFADQPSELRNRDDRRPTPLLAIVPGVPRDLLAIVETALARDPRVRYPSAEKLADDLAHFLGGRLVAAYEYSRGERFARWFRKHRVPVAIALAAVIALTVGGTVSVRRILAERARADAARDIAESRADELVLRRARDLIASDPTAAVALLAQYPADGPQPDEVRMIAAEATSRGVARHVLGGHAHAVSDVGISADGVTIVSAGIDGSVWRWDAETGRGTALVTDGPAAQRVALAPDGKLAVGFSDGSIKLWDPHGVPRTTLSAGGDRVRALAWTQDGHTLASGGIDGHVRVWTIAATPTAPVDLEAGGEVFALDFSPDDSTLAYGGRAGTVHLWTRATGATRELAAGDGAMRLAWSHDGAHLAAACRDGKTRVWDLAQVAPQLELDDGGTVRGLAWSADDRTIVTGGTANNLHVWDLATRTRRDLAGHSEPIVDLAVASTGDVLSASLDHTVRVWDLASGASRVLAGHRDEVTRVVIARSGAFAVSASKDHAVRVWPLRSERADVLVVPGQTASDLAWSPDSAATASTWSDANTRVWVPHSVAPARELHGEPGARAVAFDPTGTQVAWVGGGHDVFISDLTVAGGEPRRLAGHTAEVFALAWTPDGHLVTGGLDKSVRTWDASGGTSRGVFAHAGGVWSVAISPDGKRAATAGYDGALAITPLDGTAPAHVRSSHRDGVNALAWSPDGTRVATGSVDETIRVWPADGDAAPQKLDAHRTVTALAWSPDGKQLATAAHDGAVRWWTVATAVDRVVAHHHGPATTVAVSRDGHYLASGGLDGAVWLVDLDRDAADEARIFQTAGAVTRVAFSPDGKHLAASGATVSVWTLDRTAPAAATTSAQFTDDGDVWTPR